MYGRQDPMYFFLFKENSSSSIGPLSGYRVLDLSRYVKTLIENTVYRIFVVLKVYKLMYGSSVFFASVSCSISLT